MQVFCSIAIVFFTALAGSQVLGEATIPYEVMHRAKTGLFGGFVADALGMPVHWYYDTTKIFEEFPNGIEDLTSPPLKHPHTFMKAPEPDPELRGKKLVGDIILRRTGKNWGPENRHPHYGLRAGENTLNSQCARVVMRSINEHRKYKKEEFLKDYIAFMTDEKQAGFNDTYAEGYHRAFFTALTKGKPADECGDTSEGSNSIGGLVTLPPLVVHELLRYRDVKKVQAIARSHLFLTAPHEELAKVLDAFVVLVDTLMFDRGAPDSEEDKKIVHDALAAALKVQGHDLDELLAFKSDSDVVGGKFKTSCPIKNAWPAAIYFAAKYADDPLAAILANIHAGGENVHRGFIVGFLSGLIHDDLQVHHYSHRLVAYHDLMTEILGMIAPIRDELPDHAGAAGDAPEDSEQPQIDL